MVIMQTIIQYIYYAIAAVIGLFLIKHLFKREKRNGLIYDIVYVYSIITFLLRVLQIK